MVVKDYYDINIWITTTMPDINSYDINDLNKESFTNCSRQQDYDKAI